MLGMWS